MLSAVRAVTGHFNHVLQLREAVLLAHGQCPVLEGGCFQLNGGGAAGGGGGGGGGGGRGAGGHALQVRAAC